MLNMQVVRGDAVAVLPFHGASPELATEIANVRVANNVFVQLDDGRIYASIDGRGLTYTSQGYIVPATDEHRQVLITKYMGARSSVAAHGGA
ncbi:MAG TPA: hypothetical protein VHK01_08585 [Lacipirellulaceae bacterium]|jgi:hypothetical protein|nr:hypothetical protein [Lacipirellulaceae bacterium]